MVLPGAPVRPPERLFTRTELLTHAIRELVVGTRTMEQVTRPASTSLFDHVLIRYIHRTTEPSARDAGFSCTGWPRSSPFCGRNAASAEHARRLPNVFLTQPAGGGDHRGHAHARNAVTPQDHRVPLRFRGGHQDGLGRGRTADRQPAREQRDDRGCGCEKAGKVSATAMGGGLRAHLAQGAAQDQVVVRWPVEQCLRRHLTEQLGQLIAPTWPDDSSSAW
jgi:hypothetical protein